MRRPSIEPTEATLILILGCGGFVSAADNWIVAPILPSIAKGMHVSVAQAAAILAAYMIPYGAMQPVHGHLSEGFGRLRLLRWLMLGLVVGTLGCSLAPSMVWLCALRFVTGFFAAGMIAVSLALIGDRVAVSARQKYVGRFSGIVFLGQAMSVGLGGLLAKCISWRIIFALFSAIGFLVFVLFSLIHEDAARRPLANFPRELSKAVSTQKGRSVYLFAFASGYLLLGIYGFSGAFLQQRGALDPLQAGGVLMLFGIACAVAGASVGRITTRTGRRGTAAIGSALGLLSAVLLASSADWRIGALAVATLGLGYIFVQSTMATLAFDFGSNGLSSGMVGLGLFGGGGVSAAVGGLILAHYGYTVLWCVSAIGITGLVLAFIGNRAAFE